MRAKGVNIQVYYANFSLLLRQSLYWIIGFLTNISYGQNSPKSYLIKHVCCMTYRIYLKREGENMMKCMKHRKSREIVKFLHKYMFILIQLTCQKNLNMCFILYGIENVMPNILIYLYKVKTSENQTHLLIFRLPFNSIK